MVSHIEIAAGNGAIPLKKSKEEAFARLSVALDSIHKAYEEAGFKRARGNADRKARQPNIAARIEYLQMEAAKLAGVALGRVLMEMARVAYANMDDFVSIDNSGYPHLDLTGIKSLSEEDRRSRMAAVKSVSYTEHGPKFELHDKCGALRDLKKHLGGDAPTKIAHTTPDGTESWNPSSDVADGIARKLDAIADRIVKSGMAGAAAQGAKG